MLPKNGVYSLTTSSSSSLISLESINGRLLPRITKSKWKKVWKKFTKGQEEDDLSDKFSSSTHSLASHGSLTSTSQSSEPPQIDDLAPLDPICIETLASSKDLTSSAEDANSDKVKVLGQKSSKMFSITSFDRMIINGFESGDPDLVNFTMKLSLTPELAR
jgi:hypothetical protein